MSSEIRKVISILRDMPNKNVNEAKKWKNKLSNKISFTLRNDSKTERKRKQTKQKVDNIHLYTFRYHFVLVLMGAKGNQTQYIRFTHYVVFVEVGFRFSWRGCWRVIDSSIYWLYLERIGLAFESFAKQCVNHICKVTLSLLATRTNTSLAHSLSACVCVCLNREA